MDLHLQKVLLFDPNPKSQSKSQGGPTVDWFEIQRCLVNANADVLLIFDCCHASLATKDRSRGKLELLAATSGAGRTPCPGPDSFTRHLKEELEKALSERGSMQVDELHGKIDQRTRVTPLHFNMRRNPSGSIILRPISQFLDTSAPLGAFTFTVSVTEVPTRNSIRQLGEWMKRTAPNTVSDISVDKIIDLSTNLESFLLDVGQANLKGRLIDSLDPEQRNALFAELRKLTYDILGKSRITTSLSLLSSTIWPWDATSVNPSLRIGRTIIDRFESSVHRLLQSTWHIISKHPSFSDETGLEKLKYNETAKRAGISAAAGLSTLTRDSTHTSESEATLVPCETLMYRKIVGGSDRLSLASLEDLSMIIEITRSSDPHEFPAEGTSAQFAKTSSLLAQPKPEFYRILRCVGYTQDQDQWGRWFGLVFELPKGCSSYFTLEEQFTKNPRVALEKRYHLAYLIAFSISSLHDVNWVHKGIRSEDILFFGNKGDKSVNLDQPWLFGFEYTKEEPTNSNTQPDYRLHRLIYLPPSRWGVPTEKFTYEHDIYALVSLEVIWVHLSFFSQLSVGSTPLRDWPLAKLVGPTELQTYSEL